MRLGKISAGFAAAVAGLAILSVPGPAAAVQAQQSAVVSAIPAPYTPSVNDGTVYAIAQTGSTIVLGGSFDSVSPQGSNTTTAVDGLAAFTVGTGVLATGFAPTLNGTVNALYAGPTPGTVYVGGSFTTIDGESSKVALIDTTTGAIVPGWQSPTFNGEVNTLVVSGGQLFVGGYFTTVAGSSRVGLAVLDANTGALTSYATPTFTGHHNYGVNCIPTASTTCAEASTGVKSIDINPAGTLLIADGNFTSVSGNARDQVALLDLGASAATVDPSWATDAYTAPCKAVGFDTYVRHLQFSPDGSYFVIVATGAGAGSKNIDGTQNSCDAAAEFATNATGSDVRPTWIDYTGNDTFLGVAITGTAVYVGGHERWVNNSTGHDDPLEGSVPRPGIVALDPINGMPLAWNPGRNPRGEGAWALLATSDGLYVGSDTDYIGDFKYLRPRIAFFPLAGGYTLAANASNPLPGNVYLIGSGASASTAQSVPWDGTAGQVTPTTDSSVDWSTARGAFEINNEVYYGDTDGNFYMRSYDGTTFGPAVAIDPYDDPAWDMDQTGSGQTYDGLKSNFYGEMSSLTSMFYSAGRVYYTRSGNSHMFWRWFEPDSGVMGADEFTTTDGMNWSHVAGAFLNGSTLYYADSTTKSLFSVPFVNGQALGTPTIVNSSINWTSAGAFVASTNAVNGPPAPAAFTASCTGLTCSFDASASVDPGGTITGYDWTWGDGAAANDTTPTDSHSYATGGAYTVTLTVVGSDGTTSSTTQTVNPVGSAPITFQGATAYDGSAGSATATVPGTAQAGDQLLLFETYASTSVTATAPAGWTVVGTATAPNLTTAVYARTAQASDAGTAVSVNFSATVKASLTVADYAGAAGGVEASAFAKDTNTASHITPTVAGLTDGSLALSFWGDKSTGTTAWTPPAAVTSRASDYGVGGGAVSALLADSGSAVSGGYGGLTATTNAKSGTGVEWTVALSNTDPS